MGCAHFDRVAGKTLQQDELATEATKVRPVSYLEPIEHADAAESPEEIALPNEPLTLDAVEEIALRNNPVLAEALARVDAARGEWVQVGLPPNPYMGYSGQQVFSAGQAEQHGFLVGRQYIRGGKLALNQEVAIRDVQRAEQELAAQQLRLLTDVRIAFYEVLIAERRVEVAADLARVGQEAAEAAATLYRNDEVGRADPLRAQVEAESARIVERNAREQHAATWRKLAALLGLPDTQPKSLHGDLAAHANDDFQWDNLLQQIISQSPEMGAAMAEVQRARAAIDRAYAESVPDVDIQTVVQSDNGTGSANANLQVTFPIPIRNWNQGGIQRAHAELIAAERGVDRVALDLQSRLADVFQRYASAKEQVGAYTRDDGILDNARQTLELIRGGYPAELSILELLSAQRTYFQANLQYLESLRQLCVAKVEIDGMLLKNSLSSGVKTFDGR